MDTAPTTTRKPSNLLVITSAVIIAATCALSGCDICEHDDNIYVADKHTIVDVLEHVAIEHHERFNLFALDRDWQWIDLAIRLADYECFNSSIAYLPSISNTKFLVQHCFRTAPPPSHKCDDIRSPTGCDTLRSRPNDWAVGGQ